MVRKLTAAELNAQIAAARSIGRAVQRQPWWPIAARYDRSNDRFSIDFRDGKTLEVPRATIPELRGANRRQLADVQLSGDAMRWDELDIDVSVTGLISAWLGPRYSTSASGRVGGGSRSVAKTAASRANGAKGGRPPKR